MKSIEESSGIETYAEFSQTWPFIGMVTRSQTRLPGAGNAGVLKTTSNGLACQASQGQPGAACTWSAGKVYFPFVSTTTESSWDLNGSQMPTLFSSTAYEGYADQSGAVRQFGDPTLITVDVSEGGVLKQRKATTNQYRAAKTDGGNWESGRLNRATVTSTKY